MTTEATLPPVVSREDFAYGLRSLIVSLQWAFSHVFFSEMPATSAKYTKAVNQLIEANFLYFSDCKTPAIHNATNNGGSLRDLLQDLKLCRINITHLELCVSKETPTTGRTATEVAHQQSRRFTENINLRIALSASKDVIEIATDRVRLILGYSC